MGKGMVFAGSLVFGAVGGFAAGVLSGGPAAAPPPPAPGVTVPAPGGPDVGHLERRLDELSAAVLSRGVPAPPGSPGGLPPLPGEEVPEGGTLPDSPLTDRVAALERRVAALEKGGGGGGPGVPADLSGVATKDLAAMSDTLSGLKRYGDAQRVLEEILRRGEVDDSQRGRLELQLGYALRGQGRHAEAEARFRESLARVGEGDAQAPGLLFQIGWERHFQGDEAGAGMEMERTANHPAVSAATRVHSLYNGAYFAKTAGDPQRARVLLERLLNDHAGDIPAGMVNMKAQAEAWLKEVGGN